MSKPHFISQYLVLRDIIEGIDVRAVDAKKVYLTSRIENIKVEFKKHGLRFKEKAKEDSTYADYKLYILIQDEANMALAQELLEKYATPKVLFFIDGVQKRSV